MLTLRDLTGRRVAIWGLGEEGWSAIRAITARLPASQISVLDDHDISQDDIAALRKIGITHIHSSAEASAVIGDTSDVVIKSPGISLYREDVQALHTRTQLTSCTNLWFAEVHSAPIIAITGSTGKSTTAAITAHLLEQCGVKCRLAGNIGIPLLDLVGSDEPDVWVLELSSYQLADLVADITIAVLLNLYPEHSDWHGSHERYYKDKCRILHMSSSVVVNHRDPETLRMVSSVGNDSKRAIVFFDAPQGIHSTHNALYDGERFLCEHSDGLFRGAHNLSNASAALTALKCLGYDPVDLVPALATFTGLPHRQQILGEQNGLLFVNDSIAKTPQATIAALKHFSGRPTTLLIGGSILRDIPYRPLIEYLGAHPVSVVIGMPDNGAWILQALREAGYTGDMISAADLAEAVSLARQVTPPGGLVLLSPAATSYGQFRNYQERGNTFIRLTGFLQPGNVS